MTRVELEAQYKVNEAGGITNPGKFEGEPLWVPYFWDKSMDGGGDEELDFGEGQAVVVIMKVTPEDVKEFPELEGVAEVALEEQENGFVNSNNDPAQIAEIRKENEKLYEEAEDPADAKEDSGLETASALIASVADKEYFDVNDKLRVASILSQAGNNVGTTTTDMYDHEDSLDANATLKLLASTGYTDLLASERARELLGMASKKFWNEAHKEIKKRFEKQMMDEVKRVQKWGINQAVGEQTIKEIIKKTLQENGIYPYPTLLEMVYRNPFAEVGIVPVVYDDGKTVHQE